MKPWARVCTALAVIALAACSRPKEGDNYTHVAGDDAAMNAAITKAKATVGDFVQAFHDRKPGMHGFHLKKPYPTLSGGSEHMWIEVDEEEGGVVKGHIANEAEETKQVKIGQAVSLKLSEISDWKYLDGRKLVGGFTIRFFVDQMSAGERKAFLQEAGFEL